MTAWVVWAFAILGASFALGAWGRRSWFEGLAWAGWCLFCYVLGSQVLRSLP